MKHFLRTFAAAFALIVPGSLHSQIEFGNLSVVQNDAGNTAASVTLTKAAGSSPNFSILGGNRGDYDVSFGSVNDATGGVAISAISQNGRNNASAGDTIGLFYATSAVDHVGSGNAGRYWLPIFRCADGDEVNINVATAWFPYNQYLGGLARNSAGTNGGANNTLAASPGITLGTHFVDNGGGSSTVNLTSLGGSSANGVLLVTHAKNEDNYAAARANADGSFTVFIHDNGVNSNSFEQDPVAFVYLPVSGAGSSRLVALGRANSNATTDVAGGNFTLAKGGTGQWYLSIAGHNNTTGVLIVTPETTGLGSGSNTGDNVVSYQWDVTGNRWVIEARDLSGATVQPTLQDGINAAEDVFSFAFFSAPGVPAVAVSAPVAGATYVAPAGFTVEATATVQTGSITQVEFLRNGTVVGTDSSEPYSYTESGLASGVYNYAARATSSGGDAVTSDTVPITVALPAVTPANTALRFDGLNDYVTMGVAPELNAGGPPTNGLTLECWFRKEGNGVTSGSGSGGVTGVPLFGKGRGENDGSNIDCDYFFGINAAGLLVADFETYPAAGLTSGQNYPITATNAPIQNYVWHHAAVTYDGAMRTWFMYLDGVQVGTATAAAGALPRYDTIQHFGIGAAFNSSGVAEGAFAGTIDEVRVWNYARSATEIAGSANQEIGAATGLIGRFGLNEGSGTSVVSSTAATIGTLTNGTLWVDGAPALPANTLPTLSLTTPTNGTDSFFPVAVDFQATAADADGSVAKVEFFVDGSKVGEDTIAPYSFSWTPPAIAAYSVTARAVDNLGSATRSPAATLNVIANPNQPSTIGLAGPADGAVITGSSANLSVNLNDPEGDTTTVTFYGRVATPVAPGPDFTLVAIPDTQYYSEGSSGKANTVTVEQLIGTFGAQTKWVVDNKTTRNVAFVSHMGDIVENGNFNGNPIQWQRASAAMGRLENHATTLRAHGIPYGLAPGNHDIDPIGNYDSGSTSFFNQFFNISRFAGRGYWGGNYGTDNTNNYQLFSASGLDFIAIHLAYDTTQNTAILNWADALLKAHPHRRGIVTSHYIIGQGNPAAFGAQGSAIYNGLKNNPNLFLLLCGHIHAEGRRSDTFEGRTVYSILSDYQGLINGGQGFLRTLTFSPANNRIRVESYSPTLGRPAALSDGLPHFDGTYDLAYNLQAPVSEWIPLETVSVAANGTTASYNWTGLEAGKNYEWYAAVSDGINTASTPSRRFSTAAGTPPTITLDTPVEGAAYTTPATVNFTATASDADGSVARVEFYADGTKIGEDSTAPYTATWSNVAIGNYVLTAVAVDNSDLATLSNAASVSVTFGDFPPTISLTAPASGTILPFPANVNLVASADDTEAPVVKVEFYSGDTLLGEDTVAPFTFPLTNLGVGAYIFTAQATDTAGQTVTSAPVNLTVFTEAATPGIETLSIGNFDVPGWTVAQTSLAPRQFNLPGVDVGDLELKINGTSVPFSGGITLSSNFNSAATIAAGVTAEDNISQPYANSSGNVFVGVLDNTNNNAAGANPGTSEQTSGIGVAYLPYASGWTGASINSSGAVLSGNLPSGVTIAKNGGAGTYTINGLSTAGNLVAVSNGDTGTLADNVISVRIEGGKWVLDTRDNAGNTQDNEFSFLYIPPATTGVYAGAISASGVLSSPNASLASLGATVNLTSTYLGITFGDGSLINPTTASLFLVGDSTSGGANSGATDNLISWSATGNQFRIFTQDLPEINGTFQPIGLRFVAIPFNPTTDSDADGIPDTYELANQLDPYSEDDASTDIDGDGLSSRVEFALNTAANSPTRDNLPAVAFGTGADLGKLTLTFTPQQARVTYLVQASDDLKTWTNLPMDSVVPGVPMTVTDANTTSPNRYLRLAVTLNGFTETLLPTGRINYTLTRNQDTSFSFPLNNPATGIAGHPAGFITAVSSTALEDSTAGWTSGALSSASAPYFLRITTGSAAGRFFPISTATPNTATSLTLVTGGVDLTSLGIVAGTDTYEIIPAHTLASLFPTGSLLSGSLTTGDNLRLWNGAAWVTYYHNGTSWMRQNGGNSNNVVIRPDQGWMLLRRGPTMSFDILGQVASTNAPVTIQKGASNLVSLLPVPQTFAGFPIQTLLPGWTSNPTNVTSGDHVRIWNGAAWLNYYHNGTAWIRQNAGNSENTQLLKPGRPIFIVRPVGTGSDLLTQPKTY